MEANLYQKISYCVTKLKQIKKEMDKTLLISDIYQNFRSKTALILPFKNY